MSEPYPLEQAEPLHQPLPFAADVSAKIADETLPVTLPEDTDDDWDDEDWFNDGEPTPEQLQDQFRRTMMDYYADPVRVDYFRELEGLEPIDPITASRWFESLTEPEKKDAASYKEHVERSRKQLERSYGDVHDKLTSSVPELYEAKLPAALEARLEGKHYALGFNQSGSSTAKEASGYLRRTHGIDKTMYSPSQRFNIFEPSMLDDSDEGYSASMTLEWAIERGYNGHTGIGRYVVVFPQIKEGSESGNNRFSAALEVDDSVLPEDFYVNWQYSDRDKTSLGNKYVAGFIDGNGDFWANDNFMISSDPNLQPYQPAIDSTGHNIADGSEEMSDNEDIV